jgi:SAM-dependent methyltransferase
MAQNSLYDDPELYDLLFPAAEEITSARDDARRRLMIASERFYLEEASKGGARVLELGCGSGRLTVLMAQNGIDVVGADLSNPMLDAARGKARAAGVDVRFIRADMRYLDLEEKFATILIPGNSLLHLSTIEELKQCFAGVRRHLGPGGRLVFDISKWDMSRYARDPGHRYPAFTLNHPRVGEITVEETAGYDAAAQVRHVVWYVSTAGAPDFRKIEYQLRVIFPQELLLLLETVGFRLEARYGEFTREPFGASSPRQVCVCAI